MDIMYFVYGLVGGILPDAIRIINNRYNPQLPAYMKSASFYLGTGLLMLLGGGTAYLMQPEGIVEALALGYSAPQIVSSLLQQKAPPLPSPGGLTDEGAATRGGGLMIDKEEIPAEYETSVRSWWSM